MYESFLLYAGIYRLVVIAAGFGAILLGYRLFVVLAGRGAPRGPGGEGAAESEFGLESQGVRITLRAVAPGTFFALFGAVLISVMVAGGPPELKTESLEDLTEEIVRESTVLRSGEMDELRRFVNRYDDGLYDEEPERGLAGLVEIVRGQLE